MSGRPLAFPSVAPLLLCGALVACTSGGTTTYQGHNTYDYFPIDGERTWLYTPDADAASPDVSYNLFVEKIGSGSAGTTETATLEYRNNDSGSLLYEIVWSSDAADGVLIHSYNVQGGEAVAFDTPVSFADYKMVVGDVAETATNGMTITSELVGVETCENYWTDNVWECLHFSVSGIDAPFAGDWWVAASWGPSRFHPDDVGQDWVLASGYWSGEDGSSTGNE